MKKLALALALGLLLLPGAAWAQGMPTLTIGLGQANSPQQVSTALQVLLVLTVLSMAPAVLLMTTAFTRIVIVLSFVRQAMGTQMMPPNQVIIGLALFLTFFIMSPVFNQINDQALQPYLHKQISQQQALSRAVDPMRRFMLSQTSEKDIAVLMSVAKQPRPASVKDVPTMTLIPPSMLSELTAAFQMSLEAAQRMGPQRSGEVTHIRSTFSFLGG